MGGEAQNNSQVHAQNEGVKVVDTLMSLHNQEGFLDKDERKSYDDLTQLARDKTAFQQALDKYFQQKFGAPSSEAHQKQRMEFTRNITEKVALAQFHSEREQEAFLYQTQRQLSQLRSQMETEQGFSTATDTVPPSKVKGLNTDVFKKEGKDAVAMDRDHNMTEVLNGLSRAGVDVSTLKVTPINSNIVRITPQDNKDNTPIMRVLNNPSIIAETALGVWLGVAGFASGRGGTGLDIASAVSLHWALDDVRQDRGLREADMKRITDGIVGKKEKHLTPDKAKQLEGIVSSYTRTLSTGAPNTFIRGFFTIPPGDGLKGFKMEMVNMNKELFESIESSQLEQAIDATKRQVGAYPLGNESAVNEKMEWMNHFFKENNQKNGTLGTFWAKFQPGGIYNFLVQPGSQYKNTVLDDVYQVIMGLNSAGMYNALRKDIFRDVMEVTQSRMGKHGIVSD